MNDTLTLILTVGSPALSAILVALFNNWDKINPSKKQTKETLDVVTNLSADMKDVKEDMVRMQSAQRTGLQTQILEKCRRINIAIEKGDVDYEEELKQLIILYKEYHTCGFNSQGRLYFNDTIERASEHNNVLVRELMNTYFADYEP